MKTPPPPGTVLAHSPASTKIYLSSPGIARAPDGTLFAKGDEHGPGSTENRNAVTRLFRSVDGGRHWETLPSAEGIYWASLFFANDALWMLGVSRQNGPIVLRQSRDGGRTWTEPSDRRRGLLRADGGYHGAPTPVLMAGGRIWRGFEHVAPGVRWGACFSPFLLSAALDSDWMDSGNWSETNRHAYDPMLAGGRFRGWCEGNAVEIPGGGVGNLLRVHTLDLPEQAGLLRASDDGRVLHPPDRETFRDFPGGCKKFTVRKDPHGDVWWSLTSVARRIHDGVPVERTRNELALVRSTDMKRWEIRSIVLRHPDVRRHGFQYADWIIDGDDLLAVVRTAWDDTHVGAHSQHDANFLTFHRIARFRDRVEPLPE